MTDLPTLNLPRDELTEFLTAMYEKAIKSSKSTQGKVTNAVTMTYHFMQEREKLVVQAHAASYQKELEIAILSGCMNCNNHKPCEHSEKRAVAEAARDALLKLAGLTKI